MEMDVAGAWPLSEMESWKHHGAVCRPLARRKGAAPRWPPAARGARRCATPPPRARGGEDKVLIAFDGKKKKPSACI